MSLNMQNRIEAGAGCGGTMYRVNEIFYSLQGEGVRSGTPNLFLRFSGCNLACNINTHGFDCDTEFTSGRDMSLDHILAGLHAIAPSAEWVILTGGEPSLHVDEPLIGALHDSGFKIAIETNGTRQLPDGIDWITVSPKVAEHAIRQRTADEVKYVRCYGQGIPRTVVTANHYLISPAFRASMLDRQDLDWCIQLVMDHPQWRLSLQSHKFCRIR